MNAIYINFLGRPQECFARKVNEGCEMFWVEVNGQELFTHIKNLIIF